MQRLPSHYTGARAACAAQVARADEAPPLCAACAQPGAEPTSTLRTQREGRLLGGAVNFTGKYLGKWIEVVARRNAKTVFIAADDVVERGRAGSSSLRKIVEMWLRKTVRTGCPDGSSGQKGRGSAATPRDFAAPARESLKVLHAANSKGVPQRAPAGGWRSIAFAQVSALSKR